MTHFQQGIILSWCMFNMIHIQHDTCSTWYIFNMIHLQHVILLIWRMFNMINIQHDTETWDVTLVETVFVFDFDQLYFPFQPVVHNWFIKGRGMYCSVYGKVHIKDPLLLIEKSSLCGGSGFPSKKCVNVTIWMTSNNRWLDKNQCVPVASLNKTNFWSASVLKPYCRMIQYIHQS